MANVTARRRGELVRAVFEVLMSHPDGLPPLEAIERTKQLTSPTDWELSQYPNRPGIVRYYRGIRFHTITAVKAGWLEKTGKVWKLTDAGREAWYRFTDPEEFEREAVRLYSEWYESREVHGGRAWLVRGSVGRRSDVVQTLWLLEGFVEVATPLLRRRVVDVGRGRDELSSIVDEDCERLSHEQRREYVELLHIFINRMRLGDLVVTHSDGTLFSAT